MSRPEIVEQIRQYHGVVLKADKAIADTGRQQIEAAYKCGQLLVEEKAHVRSGHWGRFCKKCGISEDTAGRYIKLYKSAGLRELIKNYRTLTAAYVGLEITPAPRQRIRVIPPIALPAPSDANVNIPVAGRNSEGTNGSAEGESAPGDGGGNTGDDTSDTGPSDIITAKRYANKLCLLLETTKDKQAMIDALTILIEQITEYTRLKAEQQKRMAEDAEFDKATLAA